MASLAARPARAPLRGAARRVAAPAASILQGGALRTAMLGALVLALLAGGWLWLRQSPLVAVEHVRISGVQGPEAAAIDDDLLAAAHRMGTLDVNTAALRSAVSAFPIVRAVYATPSLPHGLHIRVVEQPPVAVLTAAGAHTAVAADGVVLGPALAASTLPALAVPSLPAPSQRVGGAGILTSLAVLGAAPPLLQPLISGVEQGQRGLTLTMRSGLKVYFGDASLPHAKWLSLVRVLSDPSSAGASYVDVRLPWRPAAGFPEGVAPSSAPVSSAAGSSGEQPNPSESPIAALAAGLSGGGGGASAAAG